MIYIFSNFFLMSISGCHKHLLFFFITNFLSHVFLLNVSILSIGLAQSVSKEISIM